MFNKMDLVLSQSSLSFTLSFTEAAKFTGPDRQAYEDDMRKRISEVRKQNKLPETKVKEFMQSFYNLLGHPNCFVLVYKEESIPLGFACVLQFTDHVSVYEVQVVEEKRRQQIGFKILKNIQTNFPSMMYYGVVHANNVLARTFYKSYGANELDNPIYPNEHPAHKKEEGYIGLSYLPAKGIEEIEQATGTIMISDKISETGKQVIDLVRTRMDAVESKLEDILGLLRGQSPLR